MILHRFLTFSAAAVLLLAFSAFVLRSLWPTQYKVLRHNLSEITDYQLFDKRSLPPSPHPLPLVEAPAQYRQAVALAMAHAGLDTTLENSDSVAFLVLKDGTVAYEQYWDGYRPDEPVMIYSITKSILSLLLGLALEDGLMSSVDQPVSDFIALFRKPILRDIRIKHLLQMTSGLPYVEYAINNPFGLHAHLTYTEDIAGLLQDIEAGDPPGIHFSYKSVDYAVLGQVLDKVLAGESISAYLQRKLWFPMGAVYPASWSIDSAEKGLEKTWCGLTMTARDLARFGLLLQNHGQWQGTQIIPRHWINASLSITTADGSLSNYQYGWWLMPGESFAFRAEGILGQFLYVNPEKRVVIVRFGTSLGGLNWAEWRGFLSRVADLFDVVS